MFLLKLAIVFADSFEEIISLAFNSYSFSNLQQRVFVAYKPVKYLYAWEIFEPYEQPERMDLEFVFHTIYCLLQS